MERAAAKRASRRLVIELVIVVLTSFHAGLPKAGTYAEAWRSIPAHYPLLLVHVVVGAVIVVEAMVFLVRCLRHATTTWRLLAALGAALVLVAFVAGDRYLAVQRNTAIDVMGIAWFAALVTYGAGWWLGRRAG